MPHHLQAYAAEPAGEQHYTELADSIDRNVRREPGIADWLGALPILHKVMGRK